MLKFQKHFGPDWWPIIAKSFFIFPIAVFMFTWGFTELDKESFAILILLLMACTFLALFRIQYITFNEDHILVENGFRKIIKKPLVIYFDKIYSLNYLNAPMIHSGNMCHLEFTFYKSGKNQSLASVRLPFLKDWQKILMQINGLSECKKSINNKRVTRLVAVPERFKDIYVNKN